MDPDLKSTLIGLLSRKFLAAMFGMAVVAFFLHIDDTTKVQFITWIIGIFSASNVVQKIANPQKTIMTEKTTTPSTTTEKTVEKPSGEAVPPG